MDTKSIFKNKAAFKGFSYGLTSGVITTLGVMIGVHFTTHSRIAVIAGIVAIAIADSFSDALGIHISEEAEKQTDIAKIWASTLFTLLSKFFFTLTFLIPILLFSIDIALVISIIWGFSLLILLSGYLAKQEGVHLRGVIAEHLSIAILVVVITYFATILIDALKK